MRGGRFLTGVVAALFAIGATPVFAQRSGAGSESTGSAVSRGGDSGGGGAVSRGDSGSTSSSSSSSSGGSSSGSSSVSSPAPSRTNAVAAPVRPSERQQTRSAGPQTRSPRGGGSDGGGRAVPRDSGAADRGAGTTTGRSAGTTSAEPSSGSGRAVPAHSRPRDGRPAIGTAVDRRPGAPGAPPAVGFYPRYYWPGYGFGLSYFYNPLWYDPFYSGYGYGGYGSGYGYGGGAYGYGAPQGSYGSATYGQGPTGSIRLRLSPKDAHVYVDGYFAGTVNDFDGLFQRLTIEAGARRIEIRADGYEPAVLDVLITPGETITYRGDLKPLE